MWLFKRSLMFEIVVDHDRHGLPSRNGRPGAADESRVRPLPRGRRRGGRLAGAGDRGALQSRGHERPAGRAPGGAGPDGPGLGGRPPRGTPHDRTPLGRVVDGSVLARRRASGLLPGRRRTLEGTTAGGDGEPRLGGRHDRRPGGPGRAGPRRRLARRRPAVRHDRRPSERRCRSWRRRPRPGPMPACSSTAASPWDPERAPCEPLRWAWVSPRAADRAGERRRDAVPAPRGRRRSRPRPGCTARSR